VQEEGLPTPGTERSAEWRGRSVAEVCTSAARKIGVPLVARQGRRSLSRGALRKLSSRETFHGSSVNPVGIYRVKRIPNLDRR
jgi:hypothetical protein